MRNWLKITLFILVLVLIILGTGLALQFRKMPPAATSEFIHIALAEDLEEIRSIARDSADLDFGFDFDDLIDAAASDEERNSSIDRIDAHVKSLDPIEERLDAISNPLIRTWSLRHQVAGTLNQYSIQMNHGEHVGGEIPFETAPTLGHPIVSRVFGAHGSVVQYAEVVLVQDGLEIGFELMIDLSLLEEMYAEADSQ